MTAWVFHKELRAAVEDPTVALTYAPIKRAFGILRTSDSYTTPAEHVPDFVKNPVGVFKRWDTIEIMACPFTGELLPDRLTEYRSLIMEEETGLKEVVWEDRTGDPMETLNGEIDPRVPEEFYREDWWINRKVPARIPTDKPKQLTEPDCSLSPEEWYPYWFRRCNKDAWKIEGPEPIADWVPKEAPAHLCWKMWDVIEEPFVMLSYFPWVREYGVQTMDRNAPFRGQPVRILPINYCPWCGTKLPKTLHQERRTALADSGIDPDTPLHRVPEAFRSDTWWKERGL